MAGIRKELGPTARRVAATVKRIRRGNEVTTAELSRRLGQLEQPIPDTSITKTEQGTRRVDVDDLVALAAALGVTPNTLLLPEVGYLGAAEYRHLTPRPAAPLRNCGSGRRGNGPSGSTARTRGLATASIRCSSSPCGTAHT